jgi:hypothetical protein
LKVLLSTFQMVITCVMDHCFGKCVHIKCNTFLIWFFNFNLEIKSWIDLEQDFLKYVGCIGYF